MILPASTASEARLLIIGRALRAFVDGFICVLLPAYLLALGLGAFEVGVLSAATLLGSASLALLLGAHGHRFHHRQLLLGAALLMAATGLSFAGLSSFWPLLLAAFVGTLNPSSGDVSVFLPLEHARLAEAALGDERTRLFARYTLAGSLFAALGSMAAGLPDLLVGQGWVKADALRVMFLLYALVGGVVWLLYRRLPEPPPHERPAPPAPLKESRGIVIHLAALFSIDAFAGGLVLNSLLALWLFERFGLSLAAAGVFFFWAGLLSAFSQLAAPWVAKRIGLINTMVFTHIPSSVFLILAALADSMPWALGLLLARAALSQMDVPTRSAFVMAVVTPPERTAAASFTAVPRSLAAAVSPTLGWRVVRRRLASSPIGDLRGVEDRL